MRYRRSGKMERQKDNIRGPLHLVRCMGELTLMYLAELAEKMDDALDVDFGDRDDD